MEFVRKMIEHRDDYSPDERDFWKRDRYEKMTFAINNFDSLKQQKWLYRKFKFLTDYVDTCAVTGRPVLAISNSELLATDYYRKSPHSRKQWVTARRQAGVDEMLSQQGMEQAISVTTVSYTHLVYPGSFEPSWLHVLPAYLQRWIDPLPYTI